MSKRLFFVIVFVLLLVACQNGTDEPSASPLPPTQISPFNLRPDILPEQQGTWTQIDVNLTDADEGLVLAATYAHTSSPEPTVLTVTLYRTFESAINAFDEQVQTLEEDNTLRRIDGLGEVAYLVNETEIGFALVNDEGIATVEVAPGSAPTDLDVLHLLQIGVNTLRNRDTPFVVGQND